MIGKHAAHGLAALDRLLAAGIEAHAQIVLMPGVNDGEALRETLEWAWERPGINGVGIVPLGFTKHQTALHESFTTPEAARGVIDVIAPFQQRARAERGTPWVFAADEFYVNAFGAATPAHIPPASASSAPTWTSSKRSAKTAWLPAPPRRSPPEISRPATSSARPCSPSSTP